MNENKIINFLSDLESYKTFLLEDFKKNELFAKLASSISGTDASSILDWVNGVQGDTIYQAHTSEPFHYRDITFDTVKNVAYTPVYLKEYYQENRVYEFFSYRKFSTYESMVSARLSYYVSDYPDIFKKLQFLLTNPLKGYKPRKVDHVKCFTKRINERIVINLQLNSLINKYADISIFDFPFVVIEIDGKSYPIAKSDPLQLLLLNKHSFSIFYRESSIFEQVFTPKVITRVTTKTDQPIYYKEGNEYIVTNSTERLLVYNKYIYIIFELFNHYFFVLENWLVERAEQLLKEKEYSAL